MREITYAEAIKESMSQVMRENNDVFIMGEDIGIYGGAFGLTNGMSEEFGDERVKNTPISEAAISGAAVGAAMTGMRPILEIQFSDFIMIAMDNIVNQAAKMRYMSGGKANVPVVIRLPGGSGAGFAAQHSQSLEVWTAHIPGLKVVQPSNARDAKGLMKAAIEDDNPVLFYEHKLLYSEKGKVPEEQYVVPLGEADIKRKGGDITLVATGIMVNRALEAANELEKENIDIEVIDPRTLVPLDRDTIIDSVKKTSRALVVYEAVERGGYGAEIASMIGESDAFDFLDAPVSRLGGKPTPIPYNPTLEKAAVPQVKDIVQMCKKLMNK
ncbi:TPP-dependent acetoin dehydrogenase complex, E1 protein subunit beta [Oceanobacillus oncorhynchi subsp. incaldanensis]|uniref:alpha-ketoacid dehydrogenase subunit beta n=1 Tax=Oceanobacillus oncorhynchi TaxID=545501 RepID=UPI001B12654D|nr:alpha-ketoacid dehydrogenase subunit beta [Oceanobacillus oncorhynchi]GIO20346.1 TPP-dependent acetoin dehydrogenase complex, E1 protein subunit beta [Oceanobacillus oncorhynchi subsp. incaldanensis]